MIQPITIFYDNDIHGNTDRMAGIVDAAKQYKCRPDAFILSAGDNYSGAEIKENEFCVVDYYWGIKKEEHIPISKVTSAEVCLGYSLKVKGYRFSAVGTRYIVFRNGKKYLFKIIYLPETEKLFKQYIKK